MPQVTRRKPRSIRSSRSWLVRHSWRRCARSLWSCSFVLARRSRRTTRTDNPSQAKEKYGGSQIRRASPVEHADGRGRRQTERTRRRRLRHRSEPRRNAPGLSGRTRLLERGRPLSGHVRRRSGPNPLRRGAGAPLPPERSGAVAAHRVHARRRMGHRRCGHPRPHHTHPVPPHGSRGRQHRLHSGARCALPPADPRVPRRRRPHS